MADSRDAPDEEESDNRRLIAVLLGLLSLPLLLFAVTLVGGALSPREHRASASAVVDATPEQVYTAITDVRSLVEWRTGLEGVELLRAEGGTERWRERADGEQITYEIVEAERPTRLVTRVADEDLPYGGSWTYELEAAGEATRVTIVEEGWVDNLVFRFVARYLIGYESTIEEYLDDLSEYAPEVVVEPEPEASGARRIDVQGHRGARGLAPENTLAGFRRALAIGVTTLEMDLALTADDVVVVHHDESLNPDTARTADGAWLEPSASAPIRALSRSELEAYDVGRIRPGSPYAARFPAQEPADGSTIPELSEVLALAEEISGETIRYNLELKRTPTAPERTAAPNVFARAVLAVVDAAGVRDRTTFQSFDLACLDALAALSPDLRLAWLTTEGEEPAPWLGGRELAEGASVVSLLASTPCTVWSPSFEDLDVHAVRAAHAAGLEVIPWTIDDPEAIQRAHDLGVDGIISDYPDRVRSVLADVGAPLPPAFTEAES